MTNHPALRMQPHLADRARLIAQYRKVRDRTVALTDHLEPEDMVLQAMPDASPAKWHLGHTAWFFETFVLAEHEAGFAVHDEAYPPLFNSYYEAHGAKWQRDARGLLSRPLVASVLAYRAAVDDRLAALAQTLDEAAWARAAPVILLGIHHEEQHQELLLTDIKAALAINPLAPAAFPPVPERLTPVPPGGWTTYEAGLNAFGHDGDGFAYDNELPRHQRYAHGFALAAAPATNRDILDWVEDGGYRRPDHWLSDGWAWVQAKDIRAPLYWRERDGAWFEYTLHGEIPLRPEAPACHLSAYEADAYAAWSGARLPTEFELEAALRVAEPETGQFLDANGLIHPTAPPAAGDGPRGLFGHVWEWSSSAYEGYPGFTPPAGAVGEYNGKFMSGQQVCRGGSCATPPGHVRATYRNFFQPSARWQFTGVRLARDA